MPEKDDNILRIRPQEGFQTQVALSTADITIIGGAAGGGKSYIMLWLAAKYRNDKMCRTGFFRETRAQISQPGSLWDESSKLYPQLGGEALESRMKWKFPSGYTIDFEGIQYEKDLLNFQGAAIPLMFFDELTHFSKTKFMYMLSRNRGILQVGVEGMLQKPQIFASCNPDPDSWVATMIEWYIGEDGYPIKERCGKIRYFCVIKGEMIWGNTANEVFLKNRKYFSDDAFKKSGIHPRELIKSFTFIGGDVYENKKLLGSNPGYLGSLLAMDEALQDSLLRGNWKVRLDDLGVYDIQKIDAIFDAIPTGDVETVTGYIGRYPIIQIDKDYKNNYITCDAAKFGRDLCVIKVWKKWTVVYTVIYYHSSPQTIRDRIELLRNEYGVIRHNVCVDQDGVGGDVVTLGGYKGFHARAIVAKEDGDKENYKQRKDQCYFHSGARVNRGELKVIYLPSTVEVWDKGAKHKRMSPMLDWGNEKIHIRKLLTKQLRAIKRGTNVDLVGGELKLCTNTKDEQKEILGHSPDIADTIMMREDFELSNRRKGSFKSL